MKEILSRLAASLIDSETKKLIPQGGGNSIAGIVSWLMYAVGAGAVIMIVYGGIQYITSGGDAGKVAKAKNTIIWSVAGLVLAILAAVIVNFVVDAGAEV